ncbi:MAG: flagellar hook-associated protein FlgL, partial [Lachnospiraceae bacterium]|nr:flagellar hook-associated protein FlgL [Lachnospiraceae bacterium]
MRVTNNMIMNNASSNINGTKIAVDKGNTQMTTQKKIQRPSEDPVVAVRGLRLQTSLSKINQYYEKNIPDATSWMEVTETALNNINEELKEFRTLCVYGSTDTLTQDDRSTILEQLKSLKESVHSHGNADYAGRTVFTGYRTDKELVFSENENDTRYNIIQPLSADDFETVRYYNKEVTVPTNL